MIAKDREKLLDDLIFHLDNILLNLSERNFFNDYIFLQNKYKIGEIDDDFKRKYKKFYVLSGRHSFTEKHCNIYFSLLINKEKNLEVILNKLYEIPPHKCWLSYASKLIHTIDNNNPIYDSNIKNILKLNEVSGGSKDEKIKQYLDIYNDLNNEFNFLLGDKKINDILEESRNKLKEAPFDFRLISDVKLLDSLLWALYNVSKVKII